MATWARSSSESGQAKSMSESKSSRAAIARAEEVRGPPVELDDPGGW